MKVHHTNLPGVLLVEPRVHKDERGFFLEVHHQERYAAAGIAGPFVQDNHSRSVELGVLRGLHAQRRFPQGKLVRCVEGRIFDVAVDIRRGSPHFGRWTAAELSADNCHQLWVPPGFAHGFLVTAAPAQVEYKCTELYRPEDEISIAWDDPEIAIEWPLDGVAPILSNKDRAGQTLAQLALRLPVFPAAATED
ncbi:MAG: dTDP-4-dehydrorhamnose 3,5-epimerase [Thermoanaerobaculia bacterium]|nr:dTDP-4-dehydrorhamnose 3,5-epimerase [Thermoanaerobaculia bacterium]